MMATINIHQTQDEDDPTVSYLKDVDVFSVAFGGISFFFDGLKGAAQGRRMLTLAKEQLVSAIARETASELKRAPKSCNAGIRRSPANCRMQNGGTMRSS